MARTSSLSGGREGCPAVPATAYTHRAAPVLETSAETRQRPRGSSTSPHASCSSSPTSHPRRVEHEQGQPVARRLDGEHMLGGWRRDVSLLGARQFHERRADGVRLDATVVEYLRERRERLARRLTREAVVGELDGERGDPIGGQLVDAQVADPWQQPAEVHPIGRHRAGGDVEPRGPPPFGERPDRRLRGLPGERLNVG